METSVPPVSRSTFPALDIAGIRCAQYAPLVLKAGTVAVTLCPQAASLGLHQRNLPIYINLCWLPIEDYGSEEGLGCEGSFFSSCSRTLEGVGYKTISYLPKKNSGVKSQ